MKKRLDRLAIGAAARSLPEPKPDVNQRSAAERLLANEALFTPPEITPELRFEGKTAFTFASSVTSPSAKNNLVHGHLFCCAKEWQRKPAVVIVHGWNAEMHYSSLCPLLARGLNQRGLNAILVELPYHLQRRPKDEQQMPDFICDNIPGMLEATRQAIADLNGILRWAKAQGVPTTALWGFSLGGWLAGLHLCLSKAQDAAVLTTPVSSLERAVHELEFCHPIRAALKIAPVGLTKMNLASFRPQIPPDGIFLMEGKYDLFVPSDTYRELADAWGIKEWAKLPQSHISILFSRRSMAVGMDWLKRTLG